MCDNAVNYFEVLIITISTDWHVGWRVWWVTVLSIHLSHSLSFQNLHIRVESPHIAYPVRLIIPPSTFHDYMEPHIISITNKKGLASRLEVTPPPLHPSTSPPYLGMHP